MNKPITIRKVLLATDVAWEVTCDHSKFKSRKQVDTYEAAEGLAHMWGRYKLNLGDFLFSYVNGLQERG